MDCPSIRDVEFGEQSKNALEQIRRINELSDALAGAMGGGALVNIFAGSNAPTASYQIASTDWKTFAEAMKAIPDIKRNRIELVAAQEALSTDSTHQERMFWRAIYNGCQVQ